MAFPHDGKKFKKGESGNPLGNHLGTKHRSTTIKKWLEVEEKTENLITKEQENLSQEDIITLAQLKKAKEGDVNSYKALMDSAYGSPNQFVETDNTTKIQPIEFTIIDANTNTPS